MPVNLGVRPQRNGSTNRVRYRIRSAIAIALTLHCVLAQAQSQGTAPLASWLESLSKQLARCISPIGILGTPTEQASLPPQDEWVGSIEIKQSTTWIIQDGYRHTLVVHGPSNKGFIIQSGGLAGCQKVLGPFDLSTICKLGFLEAK